MRYPLLIIILRITSCHLYVADTKAFAPSLAGSLTLNSFHCSSDLVVDVGIKKSTIKLQIAEKGQFPYQVGLNLTTQSRTTWCGGSLIGEKWIVTAAHCTDGVNSAIVYLGSLVHTVAKVSYKITSSDIYQHAGYKSSTFTNDISLIKIPPVTFNSDIQAIAMPAIAYSTYDGDCVTASGWGSNLDTGSVFPHLNFARHQVLSNDVCAYTYGKTLVTADTLCVPTQNSISTCQGDSGGPLVLESPRLLVGIASFVYSAGCTSNAPSVYVRVTNYLHWIQSQTGISY